MPAAAVIPAPGGSVMNVAVKKLVVWPLWCMSLNVFVYEGRWMYISWIAADGGHWMIWRGMKNDDPDWTNGGVGGALGRM